VGISLVLFLRRARLVRVTELVPRGPVLAEATQADTEAPGPIRLLHVEGSLFFGAAGELREALSRVLSMPSTAVVVVRLKRAAGLDATTAAMLGELATLTREQGRTLVLAGVTARTHEVLARSGALQQLGPENVFQTQPEWFRALAVALRRACTLSPQGAEAFAAFLDAKQPREDGVQNNS
jgi:SulP family sulfate permease